MYLPQVKPIDGIDELLKVVSNSELWTKRIGELKQYHQFINENLDIAGTKEDAIKLESKARGLVREAEETKSQVDEYAVKTRNDADAYALKLRCESEDLMEDSTHRMETVQEEEQTIKKRLGEISIEQGRLAKDQVDLEESQKQVAQSKTEAESLKQEYLVKRAAMQELAG